MRTWRQSMLQRKTNNDRPGAAVIIPDSGPLVH